jgi:hypothetical protein
VKGEGEGGKRAAEEEEKEEKEKEETEVVCIIFVLVLHQRRCFGGLAWDSFALWFLLSLSFFRCWNIIIISVGLNAASVCLELNRFWLGLTFGF